MTERHVALLRAVNVGKRRVEMARLRRALDELGHRDVATYINSGNAVFTPAERSGSAADLERSLEAHLGAVFGFEIPTHVRTIDEIRAIVTDQLSTELPAGCSQHIVFLRAEPSAESRRAIEALSVGIDDLRVVGREIRWRINGGIADSPLVTREWVKVGQGDSTVRNVTMLVKLIDRFG